MSLRLATLFLASEMTQRLCAAGLTPLAAQAKAEMFARTAEHLAKTGVGPDRQIVAHFVPGRIEILGKHTDYAGGRSIVMAVEEGFCWVTCPRSDNKITITAVELGEKVELALAGQLKPHLGHWSNYPLTMCRRLSKNFPGCDRGADMAFTSDLPAAAGMSSSSAMMISTYLALSHINELELETAYCREIVDDLTLAAYLGTVENGQSFGHLAGDQGVGTFGGSEDHTAIICSQAGTLGQYAYCPARFERSLPIPDNMCFAVSFSGVVAEKTGAAQEQYNSLSAMVAELVAAWNLATGEARVYLADILASPGAVIRLRGALQALGEREFSVAELYRRMDHFLVENEEVVGPAGNALQEGDLAAFGDIVDRSQALSASLLGNQVPETIDLVRLARNSGALAASAFGAGFGGSVWALVEMAVAAPMLTDWSRAYGTEHPRAASRAHFFLTRPGPAAFRIE